MTSDDLRPFIDRYGAALQDGDLDAVAACYAYPGLVLGQAAEAAIAVPDAQSVRDAFAGAAEGYAAQGIVTLGAEVGEPDELGGGLVAVDVAWSYGSRDGEVQQRTAYRYLLRVTDAPRIHLVVELPAARG